MLRRRAFEGGLSARMVGVQSVGRGTRRDGQVSRDAWMVNGKMVLEAGEDANSVSAQIDPWRAVNLTNALLAAAGPEARVSTPLN